MTRPPIMDAALETKAKAIIAKHGMTYDQVSHFFKKERVNPSFSWDKYDIHRFFTEPDRLNGCCGVIEMQQCYTPREDWFPGVTKAEWLVLFRFHVLDLLRFKHRRMALITLINSQRKMVPFVQYAGFTRVSTGYNPGTRRNVNVWALSI